MERFVEQTLLYDFYGELLTEHQRRIYEEVVCDDFSISEIARDEGISRQGVHDLIKRCNKILDDYESRLHLVERFLKIREYIKQIDTLTKDDAEDGEIRMKKISSIASEILEEL
jgi:predicted DNA-binding protein YlxM (UPF0122 family)